MAQAPPLHYQRDEQGGQDEGTAWSTRRSLVLLPGYPITTSKDLHDGALVSHRWSHPSTYAYLSWVFAQRVRLRQRWHHLGLTNLLHSHPPIGEGEQVLGDVLMPRPIAKIPASPSLARRTCPRGRFDQFEERTRSPALAEPITTVITCALPRATEGFTTGARRLTPALINFQCPDLLVCGPRRVDQRCRLRILVVCRVSVPETATRQTIITEPREGLNGRDAPPEKDPIVTQLVT